MHQVVAGAMRHGPNHLCVQRRLYDLRATRGRRHLRRRPCRGKIVIGPVCGFKYDPGNHERSVLRPAHRKASAASPAPSSRFSTITMACTAYKPVNNVNCGDRRFDLLVIHALRPHRIIIAEMKTALISLEETEMTTLEMIAEEDRKAGASENDIRSLKMFIPARPRPLLVARYASPPPDAGTACGDQRPA